MRIEMNACIIATCLPLLAASIVTAQQVPVRGVVVESEILLPVPGATVYLLDEAMQVRAVTVADSAGRFTVVPPVSGSYVLQAVIAGRFSPLSRPIDTDVFNGELIQLVVPSTLTDIAHSCGAGPSPVLVGIAYDDETGVPLPNAQVQVRWAGEDRLTATTDGLGRYRFCAIPPNTAVELRAAAFGAVGALLLELDTGRLARADIAIQVSGARALLDVNSSTVLPDASQSGELVGTIIDAERVPIEGVLVRMTDGGRSAVSTDLGAFTLTGFGDGEAALQIEHIAYGIHRISVPVKQGMRTAVTISLARSRITLDTIVVSAHKTPLDVRRSATIRRDVYAGATLLAAEARGATVTDLIRLFPGITITEGRFETRWGETVGVCIRSNRRTGELRLRAANWCEPIPVVVDDVVVADPVNFLRTLSVSDYESIELLGASDAQIRFGLRSGAAGGAIILYTRGRGPHRSDRRNP